MDFGCGSKPYRDLFKVDEYMGVDFHGEGHSHENESIDVFYDGLTLPFEADRFDGIFSTEVFEHVFNLEHMVRELHRVLKPKGKMLITCPFAICEHEVPNDFARYSSYGIKDLLERNGFRVIAFEKSGTAIETIGQIFIAYYHIHIVRRFFGKIPVIRTILDSGGVFFLNVISLFFNAILPKGPDLYMNNVLLVEKK
jgi:SAM-dependent methyltransferase